MRTLALALAALLLCAAPAAAAPRAAISDVTVAVGPTLQAKSAVYGAEEVRSLAADLEADVEQALARRGRLVATGGDRLELVLVDAVPNRPTPAQLTATPWLTMQSIGLGGAEIEGRLIGADGSSTPVAYRWYRNDIRFTRGSGIWSDAQYAFDKFAERVAKGGYGNP